MSKIVINSFSEFEEFVGKEIGISEYFKVTQDRINLFADATEDHQWIHCDVEKAKRESPFHNTIAHGYLTLSLLPYLWNEIIEVRNIKHLINYGIDKLRFGQAVVVDSEVRLKAQLVSLSNLRGITKAEIKAVLEIKDQKKPALETSVVFLYHFNA
ncbi:acyl dehydratase [Dysgonomonas sp. PH5-45]|uniref:MaoC family dehydratase n=1 Tax=unclassified Dysgonomonas TaxID=2630389 RepID=UPI0024772052|nr:MULTISPECIES: MaoC family dehydratase [unclassified Dysgonomonas]MDH6355738.1 acyl dehydratase [Dysgonomonas sp. PH5-45]MDH6388635.1 acyl dehydratase [Dysgonomonas sp. PH5-37]